MKVGILLYVYSDVRLLHYEFIAEGPTVIKEMYDYSYYTYYLATDCIYYSYLTVDTANS